MNTLFILMAQFGPRVAVPVEEVRREYFPHLEPDNLTRKLSNGEIPLSVVRPDQSKKGTRYVSLLDLAQYLDQHIERANKERDQLCGFGKRA